MNRIQRLFEEKKQNILSVYFTAGFPTLDSTVTIIKALEDSGADMVEIGIPFSDPMADGPVIQRSNDRALKNGMSVKLLFSQLERIRDSISIPLLMMGYLNPVYQFGFPDFCRRCEESGIDGIIIPDLPMDIYTDKYHDIFRQYNLSNIFLISPQTAQERIIQIDRLSSGFIYMVSSSATTGERGVFSEQQISYFERVEKMGLRSPRLIGFGISDSKGFTDVCRYANGAIIGSAFVRMLSSETDIDKGVRKFVRSILHASRTPA